MLYVGDIGGGGGGTGTYRNENKTIEKIELRDFLLQKSIFIDLILKDINTDIEFLNESYDKSSLIKDAFLKKYKENG